MDNKELSNLLHQLDNEIKNTRAMDEKGDELLHVLDGDIHALLERSVKIPMQVHPSNIQHLEDALSHFEVTHPGLTELISKVLVYLTSSGI